MTRNRERNRVRRARPCDGADRAGFSDDLRDFAVRPRLAVRDRAERLRHLPLKSRR